MGNRSSSSIQASGPPPLLTAAVVGDSSRFLEYWKGPDSIDLKDGQGNNVLHALFSCRVSGDIGCADILGRIHESVPKTRLKSAYEARNEIGCTPLWILVAYGNVELLKLARQLILDDDQIDDFSVFVQQRNNQGDSPFLATCSQGNTDMVNFLREEVFTCDQFKKEVTSANHHGTTPVQIIVGNNHTSLLEAILMGGESISEDHVLECNRVGLSLFHICSERNSPEILKALLTFLLERSDGHDERTILDKVLSLKDKNGANAIHVASFCGNVEVIKTWIDVITRVNEDNLDEKAAVAMLDRLDGESRTPYWLGMLQGRHEVGKLLADEGVDTCKPKMVREIKEAEERRQKAKTSHQQNRTIDGSALLNR